MATQNSQAIIRRRSAFGFGQQVGAPSLAALQVQGDPGQEQKIDETFPSDVLTGLREAGGAGKSLTEVTHSPATFLYPQGAEIGDPAIVVVNAVQRTSGPHRGAPSRSPGSVT